MRRKALSSGWLALFVILLVGAVAGLACWQFLRPSSPRSMRFLVRAGQGVGVIGDSLQVRGVISSSLVFNVLARLTGIDRSVKPGRYLLPERASEYRVLQLLSRGGQQPVLVTIPEGFTLRQIAVRLAREEVCDSLSFLTACQDAALLRRVGIPGASAEGYLFPDSYLLPYGVEPAGVIQTMHRRFLEVAKTLVPDPRSLTPDLVILASLVEAEAEQDTERPLVASVFLNRLKRGMRLQSCATVEYVLPERKAVLSQADTRLESPYNTYLHAGLPPGPICSPGKPSLQAALHPARTNYLFFVAKGGGRHHFSSSFDEHSAAQRRSGQR